MFEIAKTIRLAGIDQFSRIWSVIIPKGRLIDFACLWVVEFALCSFSSRELVLLFLWISLWNNALHCVAKSREVHWIWLDAAMWDKDNCLSLIKNKINLKWNCEIQVLGQSCLSDRLHKECNLDFRAPKGHTKWNVANQIRFHHDLWFENCDLSLTAYIFCKGMRWLWGTRRFLFSCSVFL